MPTSWYQAIPQIMDLIQQQNPQSILDIGVGFGKYGLLIRDTLEIPFERYHQQQWQVKLHGVEVFPAYKNVLHDYLYDQVLYGNILDLTENISHYDVILLIDVLEHFSKTEGLQLIENLLKRTNKSLIVSTPAYPAPQEEYAGNKYEKHKSIWSPSDLSNFDYSYKFLPIGGNGAQIFELYPPRKQIVHFHIDEFSKQSLQEKKTLIVGYIIPHHRLTGGMKMLLEQMKHLAQKGHQIWAFFRGQTEETVLPQWSDLIVAKEVHIPIGDSYRPYINNCDVIIAGWFEQLPELYNDEVPVLYWEQGHEWLFGELTDLNTAQLTRQYLQKCYSQPCAIAAVSPFISKVLESRFDRKTPVVSNGIDTDYYYPMEHNNNNSILVVGNPGLRFKGMDVALTTLQQVWNAGYRFQVTWISQVQPQVKGISFPINYVIDPSQKDLALYYRQADIHLFTSWYEGFGMPPLEAMASGVPVVATRCGGIQAYAQEGFNALLADPGDINLLTLSVIHLLENEKSRRILSINGRQTALQFSFSQVIEILEDYLIRLVTYNKIR